MPQSLLQIDLQALRLPQRKFHSLLSLYLPEWLIFDLVYFAAIVVHPSMGHLLPGRYVMIA